MPTSSRKTILLATDQQRSVLNALDSTQPHPLAYTPYGHRTPGSGLLSLLGFNGELPDPVTGHYHLGNGYRQFNPVLMRFNSPDSWSPFGQGGMNTYAYCGGDPRNRTDPTGHFWGIGKLFRRLFRMKAKTAKAHKPTTVIPSSRIETKTTPAAPLDNKYIKNDEFKNLNRQASNRIKHHESTSIEQLTPIDPSLSQKFPERGSPTVTRALLLNRASRSLTSRRTPKISREDVSAFLASKSYEPDGGFLVSSFAKDEYSFHGKLYRAMEAELYEQPSAEILRTIRTGGKR
jgi:RHS repeat-associated protein